MITLEALLHIPKSNYAYGFDKETLHLRVRTKKNEIKTASIKIGDPYIWEKGGAGGGNLSAQDSFGWTGSIVLEMTLEATTAYYDYWFIAYKPERKRSRYAFILDDGQTKVLYGERRTVFLEEHNAYILNDMANFFCFPYLNGCDVHEIPSWVKDTVWYQIFPDRFSNGDSSINPKNMSKWGAKPTYDNFTGGDIRGIINHLDYLKDLGINGLYLCPIFDATTNHRYDTIDYMSIDPILGDKVVFKELVEEAHKRDIKIMLDAVFNHIGYKSPQWQDVVEKNEASEFTEWFYIHDYPVYDKPFEKLNGKHLNYETFGNSKGMPKVNTEHPDVIEYFLNVGEYWVKEFGIDAWRIDVANEVDHVFWRTFRKRVKGQNPEVFLLGEIWHDAHPWLQGDQFDVAMNYPLTEAMIHYFCTGDMNSNTFRESVDNVRVSYTHQVTANNFNLLDSHDTSRILTIAGGHVGKLKLAYLFMLTHSGSPCIYYGSEIPMKGNKKYMCEDHRRCMTFDHTKKKFYHFMRDLIHIRHQYPALKAVDMKWISTDSETVLTYQKENILVIINNSLKEVSLKTPKILKNKRVYDCFKKCKVDVLETMELKGYGYLVLKISQ